MGVLRDSLFLYTYCRETFMAYEGGYTGEKTGYTGPGIPDVTRVSNARQPDTNNYLATNYFKLEISRLPLVTYYCQQANLPAVSLTPSEQNSRMGTPIKWVGGRYNFEEFTVNFMIDENMKNWIEVFEWIESIGLMIDGKNTINSSIVNKPVGQIPDYFSDGRLVITNSSYKPKLNVIFHDIFPISLSGIDFNSTNTDNEPSIASATFAYTYYTVSKLLNAQ